MRKLLFRHSIFFSCFFGVLSGCVQYPLGLNESQWNALPPAQQAEYRAKQYQIDEERRRQVEEAQRLRVQQAAEAVRLERQRIDALYANARYGDIITVTIRGGAMRWNKELYPLDPVSFDLVRGESKEVEFHGHADRIRNLISRYPVKLSEDGHTFYFNSTSADRIVLVDDGWERGRVYPVTGHTWNDVNAGIGGLTISIRFRDMTMPGAPQRVIIEHR
jgi:hypothetical protein